MLHLEWMKITALQEYGMRILLQLAEGGENRSPVRIRTIAEKEALSTDYVEKILIRLRKAGLVKSLRGLKGGYALAAPPVRISLSQAIKALTEKPIEIAHLKKDLCSQFPGRSSECVHLRGCSVRQVWSMVIWQVYDKLGHIYLSDLMGTEKELQKKLVSFMGKQGKKDRQREILRV